MKKSLPAVGLLFVLALTGCQAPSMDDPSPSASATVEPAAAEQSPLPVPTPTSKVNDRDQLVKEIGETASIVDSDGNTTFEMKVTGFEFTECDNPYTDIDGFVLAVGVEMATTKDYTSGTSFNSTPNVLIPDSYSWNGYEPDGTKMADLGSGDDILNCFNDGTKLFPDYLGPGEKASGEILLNVTTESGEVAFDPDGIGGWVWEYPGSSSTV